MQAAALAFATEPSAHAVQPVADDVALYWPMVQFVQVTVPPADEKRPAGQGTGTAAPSSQYDPAGLTLLQLTPYKPAAQGDGVLVPAGHARPAGQSTTQLLLRPTSGLNLPVEQGVHDIEAFVMLYWPALHGLQTDAPPALNDMTHRAHITRCISQLRSHVAHS